MVKLPTELILHQLSFMDNTSIKKLCKSNIKIYNICKNNKNFIKKIYYGDGQLKVAVRNECIDFGNLLIKSTCDPNNSNQKVSFVPI